MKRPIRITTGFPSAAKAAEDLGVSKKVLRDLSSLAERSLETGEYIMPGVGRLVRVVRKARTDRSPVTGEVIKIPAKKVVKFRVAKAVKDGMAAQQ